MRSVEARRKRERYIDRWRREHPEVRLYLKREEYELLREIAAKSGMTIKEVVMKAIRDLSALRDAMFEVNADRVFECIVKGSDACEEWELDKISLLARKHGITYIEWENGWWALKTHKQ
ncbi:MAG: hypothetical protein LM600_05105 [Thaumarchaeota archaeon]|nr:hypothetical protein [Nitrososphaerota archaeon]